MKNAKSVSTLLANHFKFSKKSYHFTQKEKKQMTTIPYSFVAGSLMYVTVCTQPDIVHIVGLVSRFFSNPEKEYWKAVRWIFK